MDLNKLQFVSLLYVGSKELLVKVLILNSKHAMFDTKVNSDLSSYII